MNYILEVNGITKDFPHHRKPTRALSDISFALETGKILGILGPNGAGKTTLLKIIAGLIIPDKGSVRVNGYCLGVDDEKIKPFTGLVTSQERSFYERLTGRQNLEFFAAMYGSERIYTKPKMDELFDFFKIGYQDKRFNSYSSGMKQKFHLIRGLLNNPKLLLIDEPTKSLDYTASLNLRDFIKENLVKKDGKTVIFTTHRMDEALSFADLYMILHRGRVFAFGTLDELRVRVNNPHASLGEIFLKLTRDGSQTEAEVSP